MLLAVIRHQQFQSRMDENAVDEGPSTNKGAYGRDMLVIQDLIEDRIIGIVNDSIGKKDVGNPELTRED